ncbi:hypothetical protein EON65_18890 [archaeon]|nr:MAG: hypothetical protein EON65_18890 [archaeon]
MVPSMQPSIAPSGEPSMVPSMQPSIAPSGGLFSLQPSFIPSSLGEHYLALQSGRFSGDGRVVIFSFDIATNMAGMFLGSMFDCLTVLIFSSELTANCVWSDPSTLLLYPSAVVDGRFTTQLVVGSPILLRSSSGLAPKSCVVPTCAFSLSHSPVFLLSPVVLTLPSVFFSAPSANISVCSDLTIDLTSSFGNGGRLWTNTSVTVVPRLNLASSSQIDNLEMTINAELTTVQPFTIPSFLLVAGESYSIQITLCNFLGACGSDVLIVNVARTSLSPPVVIIGGTRSRTMFTRDRLAIRSFAYVQRCDGVISYSELNYTWEVFVSGGERVGGIGRESKSDPSRFVLLPFSLSPGSYIVASIVTNLFTGLSGRSEVSVLIQSPPPVARILPSAPRSLRLGQSLLLDGSSSETWGAIAVNLAWTCSVMGISGNVSCPDLLTLIQYPSAPLLSVPNASLLITSSSPSSVNCTFNVTLTVQASSPPTSSSVSVMLSVSPEVSPTLTVSSSPPANVAPSAPLTLRGRVENPVEGGDCQARWSVDASLSSLVLPNSLLVPAGSIRLATLIIPSDSLQGGVSYAFRLSCGVSTSPLFLSTNVPPRGGSFGVFPLEGDELRTIFVLTSVGWADDDLPISYQFVLTGNNTIPLNSPYPLPYLTTSLPSGDLNRNYILTSTVFAQDTLGAQAAQNRDCIVRPLDDSSVQGQLLSDIAGTANMSDIEQIRRVISIATGVVHRMNLSALSAESMQTMQGIVTSILQTLDVVVNAQAIDSATVSYQVSLLSAVSFSSNFLNLESAYKVLTVAETSLSQAMLTELTYSSLVEILSPIDVAVSAWAASSSVEVERRLQQSSSNIPEKLVALISNVTQFFDDSVPQSPVRIIAQNFKLSSSVFDNNIAGSVSLLLSEPVLESDATGGTGVVVIKRNDSVGTFTVHLTSLQAHLVAYNAANITSDVLLVQSKAVTQVEITLQNLNLQTSLPYDIHPQTFSTVCLGRYDVSVRTYVCAGSGTVIEHLCRRTSERLTSVCPSVSNTCASVNTATGEFHDGDAALGCKPIRSTANTTTCLCNTTGLLTVASRQVYAGSSTITVTPLADENPVSLSLHALFFALVAVWTVGAVFVVAVTLKVSRDNVEYSSYERLLNVRAELHAAQTTYKEQKTMVLAARLLEYVRHTIPSIYSHGTLYDRCLAEVLCHHRLLSLFAPSRVRNKRQLGGIGSRVRVSRAWQLVTYANFSLFAFMLCLQMFGMRDSSTLVVGFQSLFACLLICPWVLPLLELLCAPLSALPQSLSFLQSWWRRKRRRTITPPSALKDVAKMEGNGFVVVEEDFEEFNSVASSLTFEDFADSAINPHTPIDPDELYSHLTCSHSPSDLKDGLTRPPFPLISPQFTIQSQEFTEFVHRMSLTRRTLPCVISEQFDEVWAVDPRGEFFEVVKQWCMGRVWGNTIRADTLIAEEFETVRREALQSYLELVNITDNNARGIALLHLFFLDLLGGRRSAAGCIFDYKLKADFTPPFQSLPPIYTAICGLAVLLLNTFSVCGLLWNLQKTHGEKWGVAGAKFLALFPILLFVDLVMVDLIVVVLAHVFLPLLVGRAAQRATGAMGEALNSLIQKRHALPPLNAPEYLFLSTHLAHQLSPMLETPLILSFNSPLPGPRGQKWRIGRRGMVDSLRLLALNILAGLVSLPFFPLLCRVGVTGFLGGVFWAVISLPPLPSLFSLIPLLMLGALLCFWLFFFVRSAGKAETSLLVTLLLPATRDEKGDSGVFLELPFSPPQSLYVASPELQRRESDWSSSEQEREEGIVVLQDGSGDTGEVDSRYDISLPQNYSPQYLVPSESSSSSPSSSSASSRSFSPLPAHLNSSCLSSNRHPHLRSSPPLSDLPWSSSSVPQFESEIDSASLSEVSLLHLPPPTSSSRHPLGIHSSSQAKSKGSSISLSVSIRTMDVRADSDSGSSNMEESNNDSGNGSGDYAQDWASKVPSDDDDDDEGALHMPYPRRF